MNENGDRGWRFTRTITVGNLLVFATMLIGFIVWYTGQQNRIDSVQRLAEGNRELIMKMVPTLERIDKSMDLLSQQFGTFPLHRHVPGDGIIYAAPPPILLNSIKPVQPIVPFVVPPKLSIFDDGIYGAPLPIPPKEIK